jgi:hypothetical protein
LRDKQRESTGKVEEMSKELATWQTSASELTSRLKLAVGSAL